MADDTKAKLDIENAEKFKKTVATFHESVVKSDIAAQTLKESSKSLQELKGVWKDEVTAPMKGLVSGFTSVIPGFGLASKLSMLAMKGMFSGEKKRQKAQEKQLLDSLGLNKKELEAHRQQQAAIKAQEEVIKNLADAASEFGLVAADFDAAAEAAKGAEADRKHLNQTEQNLVDQQLELINLQATKEKNVQSDAERAPGPEVEFRENTQRWHDTESSKMVKSSDPRVLELAQHQAETLDGFVAAATTEGSIHIAWEAGRRMLDDLVNAGKSGGAAAKEQANEQRRKDDKLHDTLDDIAENTSGSGAGAGAGKGGGGKGAGGGGIGGGIASIGKGLGKGLGGVLKGIAQGLIFWANPMVPLGAAALAAAIAVIGAGIAGATWIVGKSLPTFAEGMKSFEALDGEALVSAGKGMAAVAGGMAAFGVGTAVAGLGSLVGGITEGIVGLFGGDNPLDKMLKFQEYKFDAALIKSNVEAIVSYSTGMAVLGAATAIAGVGLAIGAIGGAIAGLFGAENPLDKMLKFQAYAFDIEKIKTNAAAVKAYADAIKDFPTAPAASVFKAAKDAIIELLGGDIDPYAPMVKFGALVLNTEGIKTNALAVKAYADAIKDFPEKQPSASVMTAAKNAIINLLGGNVDPFAPMKLFGDYAFNAEGIKTNALAVKAYSVAMQDFPEKQPSASVFKAAKDAIIELLGGDIDPFAPMKAFGELVLNAAGIKANTAAVVDYGKAMALMPAAPAAGVMKAAKEAIIGLLGGDKDPFAPMKKFGELVLNVEGIKTNAAAMIDYGKAMLLMPAAPVAGAMKAAKEAIIGLLGGETDPFAPMKKFGELVLNTEQIKTNAAAMVDYGKAMLLMPAAPVAGAMKAAKNAVIDFLGGDTDPFAPMKKFGELVLNTEQIKTNAAAMIDYGKAMLLMPAAPVAGVLKAAKNAVIDLLGGETDPFAPMKKFGDLKLNKQGIIDNSGAVAAYAIAVKDIPAAPEASVLTAAKDAIIGFLGGKTDPFAPMKAFGELKLDAAQIAINAQAVTAFGAAMSTVPEIKSERSGGLLGSIASFFGGEKKMPWDQVKAFADADMGDATKLKSNAESLTAFGISLAGLSDIPTDIEDRLKGLGNGLEEFAKYIDDGEIVTITQFAEAMAKFPIGTFTGKISPDTGAGNTADMMGGKDFAMNTVRMTAANVVIEVAGGGGSITNVISAPNVNNATAHTRVEASIPISDPYTQVARAY